VNVVDAGGWLEYLTDRPEADFFAPVLTESAELLVPVICVHEVFRRVLARRGEGDALRVVALMRQGTIVECTASLAVESARLRIALGLSLTGAFALATARAHSAVLWTREDRLAGLEGVRHSGSRRRIAKHVSRVGLRDRRSDAAYWRSRPPEERLAALEEIRTEYHHWRHDAEPRLQRVHRIAER
jgi:predicted nucleic acid-binding protein